MGGGEGGGPRKVMVEKDEAEAVEPGGETVTGEATAAPRRDSIYV
jgi:hypothetical protein